MTLKEFAKMLDGREYRHEITNEEEALAKELGFVVVFGRSNSSAELRGTIYGEISYYYDGVLEHDDLPGVIYADWCPEDSDCSWAYRTSIPHENFNIYEDGELYCVGIVCDINKPKKTNTDYICAMSEEEALAASKSRMFMARCTGMRCPMQVGYKVDECELKECPYRTEPLTNADYFRVMSNEE